MLRRSSLRFITSHYRTTFVLIVMMAINGSAAAAGHARPRFEPTDLELEDTGVLELNLQIGPADGQSAWRFVVPDFEVSLGILPQLELEIDGAYATEGTAGGSTFFDHSAPDNLWTSVKLGLLDRPDADGDGAWALGVQLGPKLPVSAGSSGVGVEGLVLVGRAIGRTHLVLNLGGLVDPDSGTGRPAGVEGGLDVDIDLDAAGTFSFAGELGGVAYFSADPNQAAATAGVTWAAGPNLELSLTALVGFASGSDHFAMLFGIAPKIRLWGRPPEP
jgi:hypothetical protein